MEQQLTKLNAICLLQIIYLKDKSSWRAFCSAYTQYRAIWLFCVSSFKEIIANIFKQ